MPDTRVTKIVVDELKKAHPDAWKWARKNSYRDDAGNRIYVHPDSIVWETVQWVDYTLLDAINDRIQDENLPFVAEYAGSYEVTVEDVNG